MSHFPIAMPGGVRPWALALAATAVLSLAGCGGDDVQPVPTPVPVPVTQATPSTAAIVAAQASLDGTASPALPTSGVLTAAQIVAQQAALDGATTAGTVNINANQAALDANGEQPYKSF